MRHIVSTILLVITVLHVQGCGRTGALFSDGSPQRVAAPDPVSAMLADAADRAAGSLEKLAAVEYARSPGVAVGPVGDAPVQLRRAMTISWTGPVEPLAETLANRASYNFIVVGSAPPVPIVVNIEARNQPVIEILRDLGLQMGLRADIRVDANRHSVEVHYPPAGGVGVP